MEKNQAAGYLFEEEIKKLLEASDYVTEEPAKLEGRGTDHQIDAFGRYSLPVPFTYPIRLIAEAKCYESSIDLPLIRSFFGVITDISENYFVKRRQKIRKLRFLDTGCFFAVNSYTQPAQDFAWAHNIFLVSFTGICQMHGVVDDIKLFLDETELTKLPKLSKNILIEKYNFWKNGTNPQVEPKKHLRPSITFGIIDNFYPVVLVGEQGWYNNIVPDDTDIVKAIKNFRKSLRGVFLFEIQIGDRNGLIRTVCFTVPKRISGKIISRISKTEPGKRVFNLDVPLISHNKDHSIRRIITIEVELPDKKRRTK